MISYKELHKINPVAAKQKMLETYYSVRSIRKTARIWQTSRSIVRKHLRRYEQEDVKGLEDRSRRPKHSPNQTSASLEKIVVMERKRTNFGRVRMQRHLKREFKLNIPSSTIRNIYRRNKCQRQRRRRTRYNTVVCYDWDKIKPLEQFQIDLKHILDFFALPEEVYSHLSKIKIPPYQWSCIDVVSRTKFIAFSYEKSYTYGVCFFILVASWLKSFGIMHKVTFQTDWGEEFGGRSLKKIARLQKQILDPLGVNLIRIRKGHKEDNAFIERSHRTDDEEFYIPQGKRFKDKENFLYFALRYIWRYNTDREHFGKGMDGRTPLRRLKESHSHLNQNICLFPPFILDEIAPRIWRGPGNDLLDIYLF
jgi:transposase InsO family protein